MPDQQEERHQLLRRSHLERICEVAKATKPFFSDFAFLSTVKSGQKSIFEFAEKNTLIFIHVHFLHRFDMFKEKMR